MRPRRRLAVVQHHPRAFEVERLAEDQLRGWSAHQPPEPAHRRPVTLAVASRHADARERMHEPPALARERPAKRLALPVVQVDVERGAEREEGLGAGAEIDVGIAGPCADAADPLPAALQRPARDREPLAAERAARVRPLEVELRHHAAPGAARSSSTVEHDRLGRRAARSVSPGETEMPPRPKSSSPGEDEPRPPADGTATWPHRPAPPLIPRAPPRSTGPPARTKRWPHSSHRLLGTSSSISVIALPEHLR